MSHIHLRINQAKNGRHNIDNSDNVKLNIGRERSADN